jgi:hypothetical protein
MMVFERLSASARASSSMRLTSATAARRASSRISAVKASRPRLREPGGLLQASLASAASAGGGARRRLGCRLARRDLLLALAHVVELALQIAAAPIHLAFLLSELGRHSIEIPLSGLLLGLDVGPAFWASSLASSTA